MARKLRKIPRNPLVLLVELLVPWIAMALVAILLVGFGVQRETAVGIALVVALAVTGMVFLYEQQRKKKLILRIARSERRK